MRDISGTIAEVKQTLSYLEDIKRREEELQLSGCDLDIQIESEKIKLEALEKQTAKKPYKSYYNEGNYEWVCSTCKSTINEPHRKYCGWCGQKIGWE